MSRQLGSALIVLFTVAIAVASYRADENAARPPVTRRGPSSLGDRKASILGTVEKPNLKHTSKLHGPLTSSLELVGSAPKNPGDQFTVRATIQSDEEMRNVDFKWALPVGIRLIAGQVTGRLDRIAPGKAAELQLELQTETGGNHQIHLIAGSTQDGTRFAQSAQFNTLLEPELEAERQERKAAAKAGANAEDSKRTLRVQH